MFKLVQYSVQCSSVEVYRTKRGKMKLDSVLSLLIEQENCSLSFALDEIGYKSLVLAHRIEICSKMFRKHHLT